MEDVLPWPGNANMAFDLRPTRDVLRWPGNANMAFDYGRRKTDFRGRVMRIWHSTYGRRKMDFRGRVMLIWHSTYGRRKTDFRGRVIRIWYSTYGKRKTDFRGRVMRIWHSTYGKQKKDFCGRVMRIWYSTYGRRKTDFRGWVMRILHLTEYWACNASYIYSISGDTYVACTKIIIMALDNAANKEEPVRRGPEAGAPRSTLRRSMPPRRFPAKLRRTHNLDLHIPLIPPYATAAHLHHLSHHPSPIPTSSPRHAPPANTSSPIGHHPSRTTPIHQHQPSPPSSNDSIIIVTNTTSTCHRKGKVVDVFIPNRKSKARKRFAFVRFIRVDDLDRLINNLCMLWVGRLHLQANILCLFVVVVNDKQGFPALNSIDPPALVLDDDCVIKEDLSRSVLGKVNVLSSIANLYIILNREGFADLQISYLGGSWVRIDLASDKSKNKLLLHKGVLSWFDVLKAATNDFVSSKRIVWVDIEGIPLYLWSNETFSKISKKWRDVVDIEWSGVHRDSSPVQHNVNPVESLHGESSSPLSKAEVNCHANEAHSFYFSSETSTHIHSRITVKGGSFFDVLDNMIKIGQSMGFVMEGDSVGNSSGILCAWEETIFEKENVSMSDNFIAIYGMWLPTSTKILIVAIYAPQSSILKCTLWKYISGLINRWNGETVVLGDFNEVRSEEERFGSIFNQSCTRDFNCFISSYGLVVVKMEGFSFTWVHLSAKKMSKVDRFLFLDGIILGFLAIMVVFLDRHLPDHHPIILNDIHTDFGPTPFRTFHSWFSREGFDAMVEQAWSLFTHNDSNRLIRFKKKLQDLKSVIRSWVRDSNDTLVGSKNSILKTLGDIDKALDNVLDLDINISSDEVRVAVWDCGENKSPGSDGYTFEFFRQYWNVIVVDAKLVTDFCPISLIGSVYKVVTKILANRLATVISDLVSNTQSAFVAKRQILDGPFILNEVLSWCKSKRKHALVFKVDFAKAYDYVRWDFLFDIIHAFGFGSRWCMWIRGDPLAPLLFILVMETLHISVSRAVNEGKWSDSNLDNMLRILNCFYLASGLRINVSKSQVLGIGVPSDIVQQGASRIGCDIMKMPFKYLRVMVGDNMSRLSAWSNSIQKIHAKLSKWKVKTLSIGGRLTLLKSILGATPVYNMSIFKAPLSVLREMKMLRNNFFIGGDTQGTPSLDASFRHHVRDGVEDLSGRIWCRWLDLLPTSGNLISRGVLLDSSYSLNCDWLRKTPLIIFSGAIWLKVLPKSCVVAGAFSALTF
nr:RNA-directed DNA polymerase, eukaryota [Tanacetum cinerariifolium]